MLTHGGRTELANGVALWGAVFSAAISLLILLGMCGVRVYSG